MIKIIDAIKQGFGYVLEFIYNFTGSYAVALLFFAIFIKLILFPLGIKQQKNSIKQARLRPKEAAIRKKYAGRNDKPTQQKMQQEIMDLYSKENFNPMSGCLPLLIQLPILIILLSVIRNPLTYISHLNDTQTLGLYQVYYNESVGEAKDFELSDDFALSEGAKEEYQKDNYNYQLKVIQFLHEDKSEVSEKMVTKIVGEDFENPNFKTFGIDLMKNPDVVFKEENGFANNWALLFIPILTFLASFFGQKIQKKFTYTPETAQGAQNSFMLNWFMPLFSVYISFIWCGAIGLYWVYQNILSVLQQYILSKMYPLPTFTEEEMKQAEREYFGRTQKAQKAVPINKKRSLVYDDDDEVEEVVKPAVKPATPKKTNHPSIEPAALKDDEKTED